MRENLLQQYFDREGPKGDLSPKQWETVLNHVRTHTEAGRRGWSLGQRLAPTTHLRWFAIAGLSRAWTAVGVLLIAATFAALGFGLAVLVLSNGHDMAPAAQPDATLTPTTESPTPAEQQAGASAPPVYVPDYPRYLDHIRETVGSVFVPTHVPDGYRLSGATVTHHPELRDAIEASLVYQNAKRRMGDEAVGEFFMYQHPEGWDADTHRPLFVEQTINGLTVRLPRNGRDRPAFDFQADGRWLYISVFGESEENVDINELVKVAKSVKRFGKSDSVDWLSVSGITRHGFENTALAELNDFARDKNHIVYIPSYLPDGLGLSSVRLSEETGDFALEFQLPSYLGDGVRLGHITLATRSHPTQYRDQVDVGGSTGYVLWGTSSSDVTLVFQHDGRWFELNGSPTADKSVLDELIKMALSLEVYTPSEPGEPAPTNPGTASVIPSTEGIESMLSGDTLARYRALPPAFQTALDTYAWFGVPTEFIPLVARDKMDQWGDAAVPLAEIIGEERSESFRDTRRHSSSVFSKRIQVRRADLLLSGYVYLLAMEPSAERRLEVMRQLSNVPLGLTDWRTPESDDSMPSTDTAPDSLTWLAPPPPDAVLTKTALARLDQLGPGLRQGLFDFEKMANEGWRNSRDMANWLTYLEMFLLKVEPGLEVPSIEAYLSDDSLETFEALSPEWRELAVASFQGGVIVAHVHNIAVEGSAEIPLGTFDLEDLGLDSNQLKERAESAVEWAAEVEKAAEEERRKNAASPSPIPLSQNTLDLDGQQNTFAAIAHAYDGLTDFETVFYRVDGTNIHGQDFVQHHQVDMVNRIDYSVFWSVVSLISEFHGEESLEVDGKHYTRTLAGPLEVDSGTWVSGSVGVNWKLFPDTERHPKEDIPWVPFGQLGVLALSPEVAEEYFDQVELVGDSEIDGQRAVHYRASKSTAPEDDSDIHPTVSYMDGKRLETVHRGVEDYVTTMDTVDLWVTLDGDRLIKAEWMHIEQGPPLPADYRERDWCEGLGEFKRPEYRYRLTSQPQHMQMVVNNPIDSESHQLAGVTCWNEGETEGRIAWGRNLPEEIGEDFWVRWVYTFTAFNEPVVLPEDMPE